MTWRTLTRTMPNMPSLRPLVYFQVLKVIEIFFCFFLILRDEDFFLILLQVVLVGPCVVTVELTTDHTRECQICCQIKFADKL